MSAQLNHALYYQQWIQGRIRKTLLQIIIAPNSDALLVLE